METQRQQHNPERLAVSSFIRLIRWALHLLGCGVKRITLQSDHLGSGPSEPILLIGRDWAVHFSASPLPD